MRSIMILQVQWDLNKSAHIKLPDLEAMEHCTMLHWIAEEVAWIEFLNAIIRTILLITILCRNIECRTLAFCGHCQGVHFACEIEMKLLPMWQQLHFIGCRSTIAITPLLKLLAVRVGCKVPAGMKPIANSIAQWRTMHNACETHRLFAPFLPLFA